MSIITEFVIVAGIIFMILLLLSIIGHLQEIRKKQDIKIEGIKLIANALVTYVDYVTKEDTYGTGN